MMKICPECFNVNGDGAVCKTCGFPLKKKVVRNLDDYYFYDAIELYNLGHIADAEKLIREKQKTVNDPKLTLLIEKFELANSLLKRGQDGADRALDKLRQGDLEAAMGEVQSAKAIYTSQRFLEIEQQIQHAMSEKANRDRAHTLYEDSKVLFANGSTQDAIQTLQEALKLSGNNSQYKAEYDRQVEEVVSVGCESVRSLLSRGDYKAAENALFPILQYSSAQPEIRQLQLQVQEGLGKQSKKKRIIYSISAVMIIAVAIGLGWFLWQNNQKKALWDAALSDGSIPTIEAFIQGNPESEYLPDALQKLAELKTLDSTEWAKANLFISSASMQTYLTSVKSIKGMHIDRATAIIDSIDWFAIENSEDGYQFENYINTHPTSQYISLARNKISEQVTGSERDNLLAYINEFNSTFSNNNLEDLMMYFEPITPLFGNRKNISKADLRLLLEEDRKTIESTNTTIDPVSFKVKKDDQNNYYLTFYSDTYTTRIITPIDEEAETQSVEYFTNSEYTITLNENRKVVSYKYKIISEKQIK